MGEAERLDPAHLVELYQCLPDDDRGTLIHLAEYLASKRLALPQVLAEAPLDDEPLTDEDAAAIESAMVEYQTHGGKTLEQVKAEL